MPESDKTYEIPLREVRISYPHLFEPWSKNPNEKKKYSAVFLLDKQKHKDLIKQVAQAMKVLCTEQARDKRLPAPDKLCLRDGDQIGRPENEGCWTLNASEDSRPVVVNRDKTPLTAEDDVIYPGCVVNARIRLWYQDNQYGKRVNANLLGVQTRCSTRWKASMTSRRASPKATIRSADDRLNRRSGVRPPVICAQGGSREAFQHADVCLG